MTNKIDAKGRVSVPAHFRSIIQKEGHAELYALRSLNLPALEVGGPDFLARYEERLASEDPFQEGVEDWAFYLHADGTFLKLDQDGRITINDFIREHTGIAGEVTFAGAMTHFQMWRPERFEAHRAAVRERLSRQRLGASAAQQAPSRGAE